MKFVKFTLNKQMMKTRENGRSIHNSVFLRPSQFTKIIAEGKQKNQQGNIEKNSIGAYVSFLNN